jgi:hypothetical protein
LTKYLLISTKVFPAFQQYMEKVSSKQAAAAPAAHAMIL